MTTEERLSRLEGAYEQVDQRLGDLSEAVNSLRHTVDEYHRETNQRFDALREHVDSEIGSLRAEMYQGFGSLREEMNEGDRALREELHQGFGSLREEMNEGNAALREEMHQGLGSLREEMNEGNARLREEIGRQNGVLREDMGGRFVEINSRLNNLTLLAGGAWVTTVGIIIGLFLST